VWSGTVGVPMEQIMVPRRLEVRFHQRCGEWDARSMPYLVDENGLEVCSFKQNVPHPGLFDERAVALAEELTRLFNSNR